MTSTVDVEETVVHLPKDILDLCNGFTFDFGSSLIKVAYLAKSDWENKCLGESEGPLRLRSFCREEIDDCLEFLKNNAFIRRSHQNPRPVIFSTGVGAFQYGALLEEKLNLTLENVNEHDGFALTIRTLVATKPLEEFCYPFEKEESDASRTEAKNMLSAFQVSVDSNSIKMKLNPLAREELDRTYDRTTGIDTYCLGTLGSAFTSTKTGCFEDDKHSLCGFNIIAGKSFLGLGCLLTGAKSYAELLSLAEKGNNLQLDITEADVLPRTDDTKDSPDSYSDWSKTAGHRPVFSWAKAVGKNLSDFKREDLARTLVYTFCYHAAVSLYESLMIAQVNHIFVAGSFCNHPLIRKIVLSEFEYRKFFMAGFVVDKTSDYHLHILRYGSYFGALGAVLKGGERQKERAKKN